MKPLNLRPLPCVCSHVNPETAAAHQDSDGFVDDEVVLALLRQPGFSRSTRQHGRLALTPNELDFAGWGNASAYAS